ncbi:hypothetical protein NX059_001054 [Plenodomus lindquistii]|nr:hypothetical protein NX059_001054 [Plenodomus lindquistii]
MPRNHRSPYTITIQDLFSNWYIDDASWLPHSSDVIRDFQRQVPTIVLTGIRSDGDADLVDSWIPFSDDVIREFERRVQVPVYTDPEHMPVMSEREARRAMRQSYGRRRSGRTTMFYPERSSCSRRELGGGWEDVGDDELF